MPLKRLLITLAGLAVLVGLFYLYHLNPDLLLSSFFYSTQQSVPTWIVFLLFGIAILLLPFLLNLIQDVRNLPTVWSSRRQEKTARATEQRYARAVEDGRAGDAQAALDQFRALLDHDPEHLESLLAAGTLHRRRGQHADAVELHKRAGRLRPEDPRTLSELGADYEAAGETEKAMAVLGELISRHPRHTLDPYRRMRALCVGAGDWEKAWKVQQRITDLERDQETDGGRFAVGIRYEMALEKKRDGQTRDADNLLRRLVREAPDFAPAALELGRTLAAAGKGPEAVRIWKAGFTATGIPMFLDAIQEHHMEANEPDQAIEAICELGQEGERSLLCRLALGRLFERLEMVDQALEEFLGLEGELPASPVVVHHIARLMERRGRHQEAASRYAQLLDRTAPATGYHCRDCGATTDDWRDRCGACGAWGSLVYPVQENLGSADPGISSAPVYSTG